MFARKNILAILSLILVIVLLSSTGGQTNHTLAATAQPTATVTPPSVSGLPIIAPGNASQVVQIKRLKGAATGPAWSPNGQMLAVINLDILPSVLIYALPNLDTPIHQFKIVASGSARATLVTLQFSPDGETLAVGGSLQNKGGYIWLYSVSTGKLLATLPGHKTDVFRIGFSTDEKLLFSAGDVTVNVWNLVTHTQRSIFQAADCNKVAFTGVAFSADLTSAALACTDGSIQIWDPVRLFTRHNMRGGKTGPMVDLTFSADASLLASAGNDKTVRIWEVAGARQIAQFEDDATSVTFSPDKALLAGGGASGQHTLWLWDVKAGQQVAALQHTSTTIKGLTFSPDGTMIASDHGSTVIIWGIAENAIATTTATAEATAAVTNQATSEPTLQPTTESTLEATAASTTESTIVATAESTTEPTINATIAATVESTAEATNEPTGAATADSTTEPTSEPTSAAS